MTETGWRLLTASALIPLVVLVVLGLPEVVFQAALVLVFATAAWEWSRVAGLAPALVYAAAAGACVAAAAGAGGIVLESLVWLGVGWWMLAFVAVARFRGEPAPSMRRGGGAPAAASIGDSGPAPEARTAPAGGGGRPGFASAKRPPGTPSQPPGDGRAPAGARSQPPVRPGPAGVSATTSARLRGGLAGWLVLVPAGAALAALHARPGGPALVMTLLAVVWAADSGAWLAGRRFGRTRLAPRVSPGKTWEGVAGGLLAGAAAGAAAAWWFPLTSWVLLLAAVLAAGASVVGDLYESLCKRRAGVKDSGRLLPGHGGLLDRIDGLTAAAPVYAVAASAG